MVRICSEGAGLIVGQAEVAQTVGGWKLLSRHGRGSFEPSLGAFDSFMCRLLEFNILEWIGCLFELCFLSFATYNFRIFLCSTQKRLLVRAYCLGVLMCVLGASKSASIFSLKVHASLKC